MAERTRGYANRIDVAAPVELLWRGLVEPQRLQLWCGAAARITPRAGGGFWVRVDGDLEREAHIDVFEPGRRLRLIYMPPRALPELDAVLVDDFILRAEDGLSVLHLLGSGFPVQKDWDDYYARLRRSWGPALARLKVLTERDARLALTKR